MRYSTRIPLILSLAFVVVMAITGNLTRPADSEPSANLHPALTELAATGPETHVSVIVQATDIEQLRADVEKLGGLVTKDLSIIDAIAVEMQAGDVDQLAANPTVRWVSLDSGVESTGNGGYGKRKTTSAENYYLDTLNVPDVWAMGYDGSDITVAVIDSGIQQGPDFEYGSLPAASRILATPIFGDITNPNDKNGHGTHVAGIVGGNGKHSDGTYAGVAPMVGLIGLNISNESGLAYESDVVESMQWILENKDAYNIRVVNLSLNSTAEMSYHDSPMNAAAEILWFNGIVVVTSAGNRSDDWSWDTIDTAPANDPFLITVGASNESGDADRSNDYMALMTANDITLDGFRKPDVVAPGKDIVSVLSAASDWELDYPERVVDGKYFRISGTSMSAPMVAGAVALLLQAEPDLTPDQVKYRLMNTGDDDIIYGDFAGNGNNFDYLDVYDLITTSTSESANTGQEASQLLWTGDEPVVWGSVAWNSVAWNSVAWNSVAWNSVAWNSVAWNSVSWDD